MRDQRGAGRSRSRSRRGRGTSRAGAARSPPPETSTGGRVRPQRFDHRAHDRQPDAEQAATLRLGAEALASALEDLLLAASRRGPGACAPAAAPPPRSARRGSSRRARARSGQRSSGRRPGSRRNCVTSSGTSARRFSSASICARLGELGDLLLDRLADPGQLLRLAGQRELGDGARRLADPGRSTAVRMHPEPLLAEELGEVREQLERVRDVAVARESLPPGECRTRQPTRPSYGPAGRIAVPRAVVCLPTYNERENLEPMVRALGDVLDLERDRVLVIDDGSPDGTGAIADALAGELPVARRAAPPDARRASGRRTSPGSDARSQTAPSSCSRWTATSRTTPPTCRA